jgi:hypothetical protein
LWKQISNVPQHSMDTGMFLFLCGRAINLIHLLSLNAIMWNALCTISLYYQQQTVA